MFSEEKKAFLVQNILYIICVNNMLDYYLDTLLFQNLSLISIIYPKIQRNSIKLKK